PARRPRARRRSPRRTGPSCRRSRAPSGRSPPSSRGTATAPCRPCRRFGRCPSWPRRALPHRVEIATVLVVRRAGALGGHHGGAQGMLRVAVAAEGGAVGRLTQSAQDEAADAARGLLGLDGVHVEALLGVVLAVLVTDAVAGLRDGTHPAPLAIGDLEDLEDEIACGPVPVPGDRPHVL